MSDRSDLLRAVRALELVARRNVSSLLSGNYRTTIIGRGLEFHEARRYVPGDPVRSIDWKITARLNEAHVRTFVEERQREVFIALDVSPSMYVGWQRLTKIEAAIEMAATIAVSAVTSGDRLGWVCFAEDAISIQAPRQGPRQLYRALSHFVQHLRDGSPAASFSDPRSAFHAIQSFKGRRTVVFVISDFIDHDVPDDLRYITRRHDVSLLHLYDPLEFADMEDIRIIAASPEGQPRTSTLRLGSTTALKRDLDELRQEAIRHRIPMRSFATSDPIGPALASFFRQRRVEQRR